MSPHRARAADWKAVAEIRGLQSRAAEMEAARAGAARIAAADERREADAALDAAQAGWSEALAGNFDPGVARHWFAHVGDRQDMARAASEELRAADAALDSKRAAWSAADSRAEIADAQHRSAACAAARHREAVRLGEIEDRASRQRRET